jgi:hypothetical protein
MTADKQQKAYGMLMFIAVVLLLAAQFGLQYIFRQASEELISVRTSLTTDQRTLNSQRSLSDRYKSFQLLTAGYSGVDRQFPINGRELFTALDAVMSVYNIEFTNSTPNAGVQPGTPFTLQIVFNGQYYNVLKAIAAIRESNYIMRISDLKLNAEGNGTVRGSMSIVSASQAQS